MKKLLILSLITFNLSIQAESYFCQYDFYGNSILNIYTRQGEVFITTADSGSYIRNIVKENSKALYLMGNFKDESANYPGASVDIIDKASGLYTGLYLTVSKDSGSDVFYGTCLSR